MEHHYVYMLEDPLTGEFYIGSRTCRGCSPQQDEYMGSYSTWEPENADRLIKMIVADHFADRDEANDFESKLISKHIDHKLNKNAYVSWSQFIIKKGSKAAKKISEAHKGRVLSEEHKRKIARGTSEAMKETYKNGLSEEHKKSISKSKYKRFKHIPTGKIFQSGKEAAEWAGLKYGTFKARIYNDRDCNEFEPLDGIDSKSGNYTGNKGRLPGNACISLEKATMVKELIDEDKLSPKNISERANVPLHVVKDMKYKGAYESSLKNCT